MAMTGPPATPRVPAGQEGTIKTARRVFEILDRFDQVRRPMTLKEVVEHLHYPVSSASALLKTMVAHGYLDYDRYTRTYMPTMRLAARGAWVQGALFGEGAVLELMRHMSAVTGETITLGTQSDLYAQYVHVIPCTLPLRFVVEAGDVRPVVASGLGWLLLSARSDDDIQALWKRANLEQRDAARRVSLPMLMERVREIRGTGYVVSRHTVVQGGGIIAMLLPARRHGRVLAIGVNGPVDRLDAREAEIVEALRESIARYLGRPDGHAEGT